MGIHKFCIEAPTFLYVEADNKEEAERIAWEYIQYCNKHVQVEFICDEWTKVFYEWELVDKPEDHEYELTDYLERYA